MSKLWQDSGSFRLHREAPHASARGKVFPFNPLLIRKNLGVCPGSGPNRRRDDAITNMPAFLPILMFHTIDDRHSVISFAPGVFRRAMTKLHERGYRTLNLLEAWEHLRQGTEFPSRALVITFDDGYETVYKEAFPVLQRYGFSATVFLTVGKINSGIDSNRLPSMCDRSMLSWREIREMQRSGIEFGAHTLTHPDLTCLSRKQAEAEICESKSVIEDALGDPVESFAYPYGRYNAHSREIVSHHFACACSDRLGLVTGHSDHFTLERLDTYYLRAEWFFTQFSSAFFPIYVKARSIPRGIRRLMTDNVFHAFARNRR